MTYLLGREQILTSLSSSICSENVIETPPKVIFIEGEAGIGKTLLANKLCNTNKVRAKFSLTYLVSAYSDSWDQIFQHLADEIFDILHAKSTVDELYSEIIHKVSHSSCLVCIDNLDKLDNSDNQSILAGLDDFISRWDNVKNSVLILTGQQFPSKLDRHYSKRIPLKGLSDKSAIDHIVGQKISKIIDDSELHHRVTEVLNGNPQKLLYLRWRAPNNAEELKDFLIWFEKDEREEKTNFVVDAIKTGLVKLDVPIEHFLSLSCLRHPVFDETLPAFLWDRLGGGSTEFYVNVLKRLLSEGLLSIRSGTTENLGSKEETEYRLNATFHTRLHKSFLKFISPERQAHIQFFLGEYFRNRFALDYESFLKYSALNQPIEKRKRFPMEDLNAFVYHTIASEALPQTDKSLKWSRLVIRSSTLLS